MAATNCSQCGAPRTPGANCCEYCGNLFEVEKPQAPAQQVPPYAPPPIYQQPMQPMMYHQNMQTMRMMNDGIDPSWPIKSKGTAAALALFLGTFGIHQFYLGKTGVGVLYLVLCATGIPTFLGIIDGITMLSSSDHNFQVKHKVRLS